VKWPTSGTWTSSATGEQYLNATNIYNAVINTSYRLIRRPREGMYFAAGKRLDLPP
jgi:hypothetical protein